ncbi:MAG: lamin tail domain-containing protein [Bacteroidota bacterium]
MCFVVLVPAAKAQISSLPFQERFDSLVAPLLPPAWTTSTNHTASGDFVTTTSSPRSAPNAAFSSNSTIQQWLASPLFDFTNRTPDELQFSIARSSTHTSPVVVEASIDGGTTYPILLGDTLKNPGTSGYVQTTLLLPISLAQRTGVRFRWRILGGAGGSSATFRLDDVSVSVLTTYDLGVSSISLTPPPTTTRDTITLTAGIRNIGLQPASGYSVKFSLDANNNRIAETNEGFAVVNGPLLSPGDSTAVSTSHLPLKSGNYGFMAAVSFAQDENPINDTLSTVASVGVSRGALVVNEIMYAPSGDEPEWVELLNPGPDSVNLKNWRISDNNTNVKTVMSSSDIFIPPSSYALVAKDANFLTVFPEIASPVVLANFSALNNTTPDAVVLFDPRSIVIDSAFYSQTWGGSNGRSLERIDPEFPSTSDVNWGSSQDSTGRTPGRLNSIARLLYDLSFDRLYMTQELTNENPVIRSVVRNSGKQTAEGFSITYSLDSGGTSSRIFATSSTGVLLPGDSVFFSYEWTSAPPGAVTVRADIIFPPDGRLRNNTRSLTFDRSYDFPSIVINEILFDPLDGQNEWIELFHRGEKAVDLLRWKFHDRSTASGSVNSFQVTSKSCIVSPGEFVVLAADSTIFTLFPSLGNPPTGVHIFVLDKPSGFSFNNDIDAIVLQDLTGATVDSVAYASSWHNPAVDDTKGRSLEKISPNFPSNDRRNWNTATVLRGGTPGLPNSVLTTSRPSSASLSISPNPFSPDGDGFEDFCIIGYRLPGSSSVVNIKIFDIKGRLIRLLANSEFTGSTGQIIWNGLDDSGRRARIGPYVVFLEAVETQSGETTLARAVVVVGTRL